MKAIIKYGSKMPTSLSTMHLYPIDGQAHAIAQKDTTWAHRNVRWVQVMIVVSNSPADNEKINEWSKNYYSSMAPYSSGGGYVNFMMQEDNEFVKKKLSR